jgi:tetratricopeptide (TPR) repeat protein
VFAFWPAADAAFVNWDDGLTVTENLGFRGFDPEHLGWMWTTSHAGHYQPLSWLSLAADHARLGLTPPEYPEAAGFHRTNIALHAATSVALYLLAWNALALAFANGSRAPARVHLALAAAFAALVHAVHPLRCESVCWVTERRDVLSGLFFVLSVLAYLRAGEKPGAMWLRTRPLVVAVAAGAGALACFFSSVATSDPTRLAGSGLGAVGVALALLLLGVSAVAAARAAPGRSQLWALLCPLLLLLSLFAKAWGIVMPALLLVIDFWPLRRRLDLRSAAALAAAKAPFIAMSVAFGFLARWAQTAQQGSVDFLQVHGVADRAIQSLYALAFYPAKTLVPTGLVPLHPIPDDLGWLEPRFAVAALVSIGITVVLVLRVRRNPGWLAAWIAYAVIVSPVLGFQQTGPQLVADRYTYLAGIPFALLAGAALLRALNSGGVPARVGAVLALAIVFVLGAATWRQSAVWKSSEALWTHARDVGPPTAMSALNLGLVRAEQARAHTDPARRAALRREAFALFEEGARQRPGNELFALNTAILLAEDVDALPVGERARTLERASQLADGAIRAAESKGIQSAVYYLQHGRILMAQDRVDEAGRRFERAAALRPEWPEARVRLGGALLASAARRGEGDPEAGLFLVAQAIDQMTRARSADSDVGTLLLATAFDVRWRLLEHLGRRDESKTTRERARQAYASVAPDDPGYAEARQRLAALREGASQEVDRGEN